MNGPATAERSVERFLDEHPDGHLFVLVGYASIWGLSWLNRHTQGRRVTLVVGDTHTSRFQKGTDFDRRQALAFLDRGNVEVLNWYRTNRSKRGQAQLHIKAWFVADQNNRLVGALNGSANLTKQGMTKNVELMTSVPNADLPDTWRKVDSFVRGYGKERAPWTCEERLVKIITEGDHQAVSEKRYSPPTPRKTRPPRPPGGWNASREQRPARRSPGCLAWISAVAILVAALLFYLG